MKTRKKGDRMLRKLISLTPEMLSRVKEFAEQWRIEHPGARFDLTDGIRVLIGYGLRQGKEDKPPC